MAATPLPDSVLAALRAGNKITAIRELRSAEPMDLATAKTRIEHYIAQDPQLTKQFAQQAATNSRGCLLILVVILLAGLFGYAWYVLR